LRSTGHRKLQNIIEIESQQSTKAGKPGDKSQHSTKKSSITKSDDFFINVKDLDDFDKVDYKMYLDTLDIRKSNEHYNRVVCVEYCSVFLAFFGASLSIIQNEFFMEFDLSDTFHYVLFCYIALSTLMLAFSIYQRYDIYLAWCVSRNLLTEYDSLISTGWWKKLTLELVIILMAPYPFLMGLQYHEENSNWGVTVSYEIN